MHRREFFSQTAAACACCSLPISVGAQETEAVLDFCTELNLEPAESTSWVQEEWEERPQNDEEAAAISAKRWKPSRDTLHIDFLNTPNDQSLTDKVIEAAKIWERHMDLTLSFGSSDPRHGSPNVLISFSPGLGHWSFLGTDSLGRASSGQASMNFGWHATPVFEREIRRVVLHEFGHAFSLIHEHQNPGASIPWNRQAVLEYYRRTQGWDDSKIERNIFARYDESSVNRTRYDPNSIMHYAIPRDLLTDPSYATSWNTSLSELDIAMADFLFPA